MHVPLQNKDNIYTKNKSMITQDIIDNYKLIEVKKTCEGMWLFNAFLYKFSEFANHEILITNYDFINEKLMSDDMFAIYIHKGPARQKIIISIEYLLDYDYVNEILTEQCRQIDNFINT